MNFALTDEQEELRRTVRRFLDEKSPSGEVRRLMETPEGYDEGVWKQLSQELALPGLHVPEEYGGQGFGFVELGIVLEEMGRALLCAPFFSSACLAATTILEAGTEGARAAFLPAIARGEVRATLALAESTWDSFATTATPDGESFRLEGEKSYVVDGATADLFVVAASDGLYAARGDDDGIAREALPTMDRTRKQARVTFRGARAERIGDLDGLARALDLIRVCVAAEATGVAQRCLDMAVAYAKDRVQFGRPIGQFQAVKHKCANMLLDVESARTAAYHAMWAAAARDPELATAAPMAKAFCTEAAFRCASDNIQVHGGIGFTWEHDAHLYYRRAKTMELMFGDAPAHRNLLATRLGI